MAKTGIRKIVDKLPQFQGRFDKLTRNEVLAGVPAEDAARRPSPEDPKAAMNNATIAYIQDKGSPAAHIPARPFMVPGIAAAKEGIINAMKRGAKAAVHGDDAVITDALNNVGLRAQRSIRSMINEGIPPPLSPRTVAARFRQRKTKNRREGEEMFLGLVAAGISAEDAQGLTGIKPLDNTGQLRNSINYVIRRKRGG